MFWPAPAKLNLFLHVLARRPDGYHELQTAFQFIDLCDELSFELRDDGQIVRAEGPAEIAPEEDLVVRAARRLQEAAVSNAQRQATGNARREGGVIGGAGVSIRVRKRIPMEGGLGGGSSDAATTLVALNHLWKVGFTAEELAALGLGLGADVPVFVHGHAAWAEGIGERLQPIDPPEAVYLVVRPPCGVSTREIFQAPELTRNSTPTTIRAAFGGQGRNDCEPVVRARYPQVAAALDWLARHAPARLTGTGSCVFATFEDETRARQVAAQLPAEWQGFVARGLNRSPLLKRLEQAHE